MIVYPVIILIIINIVRAIRLVCNLFRKDDKEFILFDIILLLNIFFFKDRWIEWNLYYAEWYFIVEIILGLSSCYRNIEDTPKINICTMALSLINVLLYLSIILFI